MNYLRIVNGQIVYPFSMNSLASEYPDTSFPENITTIHLQDYEIYTVNDVVKPSHENYIKLITEGIPELILGEYHQTWNVEAAPAEYTETNIKNDAVNKYENDKRNDLRVLLEKELLDKTQATTVNEEIEQYKNLYPLWENHIDSFQFHLNFKVNFIDSLANIRLFKCIQSHAKQLDWTPNTTPALWSEIIIGSGGIEVWSQPIGGDGKYPYLDPVTSLPYQVTHNGSTWNNTLTSGLNVWEPGVYGWIQS